MEAQVVGGVEEPGELVGGPAVGAQALAASWFGGSGAVGRVRHDQVGVDRVVESGAADDVHVVHGLGGEALSACAAGGEEVGVEPVEVLGPQ